MHVEKKKYNRISMKEHAFMDLRKKGKRTFDTYLRTTSQGYKIIDVGFTRHKFVTK